MKTAVEWLEEQFKLNLNFPLAPKYQGIINQAKEMEKKQTIDFGQEIVDDIAYGSQCKEWVADKYNETFKTK